LVCFSLSLLSPHCPLQSEEKSKRICSMTHNLSSPSKTFTLLSLCLEKYSSLRNLCSPEANNLPILHSLLFPVFLMLNHYDTGNQFMFLSLCLM
jgi:hypothetical protein